MTKLYCSIILLAIVHILAGCEGASLSATKPKGWIDKQQILNEPMIPTRNPSMSNPQLNPHIGFVIHHDDQFDRKKTLKRLSKPPIKTKAYEHLDFECTNLECKSLEKLK